MSRSGFETWDYRLISEYENWEKHIHATQQPELAERTIKASILLNQLVTVEKDGFRTSPGLEGKLTKLIEYGEPEFSKRFQEAMDLFLAEWGRFTAAKTPKLPLTESPQQVLNYLTEHNPFFQRWLDFEAQRPKRSQAEWDEVASQGLRHPEDEYAILMRELGQTLRELAANGKRMSLPCAKGIMYSHTLMPNDRILCTLAWLESTQQDSLR